MAMRLLCEKQFIPKNVNEKPDFAFLTKFVINDELCSMRMCELVLSISYVIKIHVAQIVLDQ